MKWLFGMLAGLLVAAGAGAQESAPDVLVKAVTTEVLEIVRKDKDIQAGNARKAMELVEARVLPHFNFAHMTALAVGRDWRQASDSQKKTLGDEFRTLLVRTYSKALTEYRNQSIDYKPLKLQPTDTEVTVRTQIQQPGGKPIALDYSLERLEQGWKVYDISVAGVSLVTNYRSDFGRQVSDGGIDSLIKYLQAKNKSGDSKQ